MTPRTLGHVIGDYEVLRELGSGAMGKVFLARDPTLERLVAIKVMHDAFERDDIRRRFLREARAAGRLQHANIVRIYHVGEDDRRPFIVMEFVSGDTLATLISAAAPLSLAARFWLMEQLCDGLASAHQAGVVHRDIKPANLIVDTQGSTLKILDFGVAKTRETTLTQAGGIVGTVAYMAPEQLAGDAVDHRADLFAATAVLYELLTGCHAFPRERRPGVVDPPVTPPSQLTPGLSQSVNALIARGLAPDRDARFQDALELRRELVRQRRAVEDDSLLGGMLQIPILRRVTVEVGESQTTGTHDPRADRVGSILFPPAFEQSDGGRAGWWRTPIGLGAFVAMLLWLVVVAFVWERARPTDPTPASTLLPPERVAANVDPARVVAPPPATTERPQSSGRQPGAALRAPVVQTRRGSPTTSAPPAGEATSGVLQTETASLDTVPPAPEPQAQSDLDRERQAILALLREYEQAFQSRSAAAVKVVWPSLTPEQLSALDRTFLDHHIYEVSVSNVQLSILQTRARVICTVVTRLLPANGERRLITTNAVMFIEKRDDRWVVGRVEGIPSF